MICVVNQIFLTYNRYCNQFVHNLGRKESKMKKTRYLAIPGLLSGCGGGTRTSRPSGYEPDKLPTAPLRDISSQYVTILDGARDRT